MEATGRSVRRFRHGRLGIPLVGALVAAVALVGAGPAVAQGHADRLPLERGHAYSFNAPTSAAVVGGDMFVTNGQAATPSPRSMPPPAPS